MIPKIIHYCWFGGNPLPPLAEKCMESWKKFCPDYEIIKWSEDNFDIESAPRYVRQAYKEKKWAFVSDYVRLYAVVKYGGIYMDTDVEVLKSLDSFLKHRAFSGFEDEERISTGIMACEKDFPLFDEFLHYYDDADFYNSDGEISYITNVTVITDICSRKGFCPNNQFQVIEGFAIYPKHVFCPISFETGKLKKKKDTVTIHWFAGSWMSDELKKQHEASAKKKKRDYLIHTPNRILMKILGNNRYERLKAVLKNKN